MSEMEPKVVIFFDGSCSLCKTEIGVYSDCDVADTLLLVDVSDANSPLPDSLDREDAMARLHVIAKDGRVLSGAAAFVEVWRHLPSWVWTAKIASLPFLTYILEGAYCVFLIWRPAFVQIFVTLRRLRGICWD